MSSTANYHQNLQIKFDKPKVLTRLSTQGCNETGYVGEYAFMISSDGDNWVPIMPTSTLSGSGLDNKQARMTILYTNTGVGH